MRKVDLEVIQEILQTKKVEFVLYEVEDVAKMLGVSERTVRRWIEDKKLKAMKLGRGWRIEHDDLMEFMKTRTNIQETENTEEKE
jgi:excisionase family DNA binding protein